MLILEIITTLVAAGRTLNDVSQDVEENHQECKIIHNLVSALADIVNSCTVGGNDVPQQLSKNLSDTAT